MTRTSAERALNLVERKGVEVFAAPTMRSKTDQARETLSKYWSFIEQGHVPHIERQFKVKLTAANYRLMYYDTAPGRAQARPPVRQRSVPIP